MVDPIRNKEDLKKLSNFLYNDKRNYAIFILGINTGLRVKDILNLKYIDVKKSIYNGTDLIVNETKTKKQRSIHFNNACKLALNQYFESKPWYENEYLFTSKRSGKKMKTIYVYLLIKAWCKRLGIKGNFGAHTLRKTFAFQAYNNGTPIEHLQRILNHSSSSITYLYIGVTPKDITDIFDNLNLC